MQFHICILPAAIVLFSSTQKRFSFVYPLSRFEIRGRWKIFANTFYPIFLIFTVLSI